MEFKIGQIITSRAGRDLNLSYVIIKLEKDRALLANGKKFTIEIPKKKNIRHLHATKTVLQNASTMDNQIIAKALLVFNLKRKAETTGG